MASSHAMQLEPLESRRLLSGSSSMPGTNSDMVLRWNDVAMNVLRADATLPGPGWSSRSLAITSIAIFDAVNSIDRGATPYLTLRNGYTPKNTSMDAAIASAAHDALAAMYPAQKASIDAELVASLATIPDGSKESKGIELGHLTAAAILQARVDDGSADIVPYTVNPLPGHWEPDPLNPTQAAWGPGWGQVTPFALKAADQFKVPDPPALTSKAYTKAFNQVKSLGEIDSTTRTADQTEISAFWAYDRGGMGSPPGMYDQQVAHIAQQNHNTEVENARLFALVNIAQADAGIAAWNVKFDHDFWRPITAIRRGNEDGNPATLGDPNWVPLGAPGSGVVNDFTPPFPAYVSGHATFGAAVYETLSDFYHTDKMRFTLTSDELPGVSRTFTRFSQAADENALSRIYMGVHWSFDAEFGQKLGKKLANYAFKTLLEPVKNRGLGVGVHRFIAQVLPGGKSGKMIGLNSQTNGESSSMSSLDGSDDLDFLR